MRSKAKAAAEMSTSFLIGVASYHDRRTDLAQLLI